VSLRVSLKPGRYSSAEVRRLAETRKVADCIVGHDNGYTTILNELENEGMVSITFFSFADTDFVRTGLLDKIFLLRGYADLAREIKNFNLPVADIEGIFMTKKIGAPPHPFHLKKAAAHTNSMPNVKAATAGAGTDRGRTTSAKTDSAKDSGDSPRSESPVKNGSSPVNNDRATTGDRYLDPTIPMSKRMCVRRAVHDHTE
jgi:hypothetical protein